MTRRQFMLTAVGVAIAPKITHDVWYTYSADGQVARNFGPGLPVTLHGSQRIFIPGMSEDAIEDFWLHS